MPLPLKMDVGCDPPGPQKQEAQCPKPIQKGQKANILHTSVFRWRFGVSGDVGMAALGGVALNRDEHGGSE